MSYKEYFDIYEKAQLKDCNYLAIFVDVVNSKTEIKDANDILTHYNFINKLTNNLEKYLKKDENNIVFYHFDNKNIDVNSLNPISIGDGTCYFFNKNNITTEKFEEILLSTMKKTNYPFSLHVKTCKYETENMNESNNLLYKGDVFRILEDNKQHGKTINKNTKLNKENEVL